MIGDSWQPAPDEEWGKFKLWLSIKFPENTTVIVSDHLSEKPEERLFWITPIDAKNELGIWFRIPKPFVPSNNLKKTLSDLDRLLSKDEGWALVKMKGVVGGRCNRVKDGLPIAIIYPDYTGRERYLFLWVQFPPQSVKKYNWSTDTNIHRVTLRSFQTAAAAKSDLMRRSAHISNSLNSRIVTVFGVGALGGSLALLLAKTGVGELRLVDYDKLMPGNVMRHICGLNWTGCSKTTAAKLVIQNHNPDCVVKTHSSSWELERIVEIIGDTDLVIDATGNPNFSLYLNKLCIRQKQPVMIVAAYRQARVGRAIIWQNENDPCFGCYTLNRNFWTNDVYPLIPPADPGEGFIEDGCGSVTEEAVALDVEAVANFAARAVVKMLRNEFGKINIGIIVNESIPESSSLLQSVGTQWWKNEAHPDCPLCRDINQGGHI